MEPSCERSIAPSSWISLRELLPSTSYHCSVEEQIAPEGCPGRYRIAREIGDAGRREHFVVDEKVARGGAAVARQNVPGSIGHDFGLAAAFRLRVGNNLQSYRGDNGARPQRIDGD